VLIMNVYGRGRRQSYTVVEGNEQNICWLNKVNVRENIFK
jgi:hypothetical protein